ncbi:hypothetical protein QR680_011278 [Steinernema hermaphroditum]|uniref:Uncharacterized protein n=1 Tax=Steinernema hermaphroditum TaxID=289476 RepID=A0AA39MCY2_9BILA|nr:hypothetical protein QR680_011278 [Steinernema hermaphroditum]
MFPDHHSKDMDRRLLLLTSLVVGFPSVSALQLDEYDAFADPMMHDENGEDGEEMNAIEGAPYKPLWLDRVGVNFVRPHRYTVNLQNKAVKKWREEEWQSLCKDNAEFWAYEWQKHCGNRSPEDYFADAMTAYNSANLVIQTFEKLAGKANPQIPFNILVSEMKTKASVLLTWTCSSKNGNTYIKELRLNVDPTKNTIQSRPTSSNGTCAGNVYLHDGSHGI